MTARSVNSSNASVGRVLFSEGGDSYKCQQCFVTNYGDAKAVLSFCSSSKTEVALPPLRFRLQVITCYTKKKNRECLFN